MTAVHPARLLQSNVLWQLCAEPLRELTWRPAGCLYMYCCDWRSRGWRSRSTMQCSLCPIKATAVASGCGGCTVWRVSSLDAAERALIIQTFKAPLAFLDLEHLVPQTNTHPTKITLLCKPTLCSACLLPCPTHRTTPVHVADELFAMLLHRFKLPRNMP
jgi:hypothetical protein